MICVHLGQNRVLEELMCVFRFHRAVSPFPPLEMLFFNPWIVNHALWQVSLSSNFEVKLIEWTWFTYPCICFCSSNALYVYIFSFKLSSIHPMTFVLHFYLVRELGFRGSLSKPARIHFFKLATDLIEISCVQWYWFFYCLILLSCYVRIEKTLMIFYPKPY